MIWRALQFDWPSAAWLLLIAIGIAYFFSFLYRYRQKKLQQFAQEPVLDAILEKRDPLLFWMKVFLYSLAWICGVFALMQPKGNERYVSTSLEGRVSVVKNPAIDKTTLRRKTHEVIFLVDASASMNIADVSGRTRLDAAKEIVDDVIRHLKGENVSLFAFTSATIQVVPSTLDYLFTRLMLQQISINAEETEGTDFKQALDFLRGQFFAKASPKTKTLIILSDGGDTKLYGLDSEARKQAIAAIISPVADAGEKNLRVFTVGIGSLSGKEVPKEQFKGYPVMSALEEPLLHKLSLGARGEMYVVGEMTPFQISQALNQNIAKDGSFVDSLFDLPSSNIGEGMHVYDFYFQFPLGLAILALMGYLLLPDTRKKIDLGRGL